MSTEYRHVQVKLPADLADWFDENCTFISKQGFAESCFQYLRMIVESGKMPTPEAYATNAVVSTLTEISGDS